MPRKETPAEKKARIKAKAQADLLALFAEDNPEILKVAEKVKTREGNIEGISEEQIQHFREAQGVLYYLQAPALFQAKVCEHCGEHYLVSRLYVAYCSYTCIRKSLEAVGIQWSKFGNLEALVTDPQVYNGNEPIWIRNLSTLQKALEKLTSLNGPQDTESTLSPQSISPEVASGGQLQVLTRSS